MLTSEHRSKFFSLMPFFCEAAWTPKNFVLKMEFFPEAEVLKLYTLRLTEVQAIYVPVKQVIPITKYDYWGASWLCWFKQNTILDLEMIYANSITKEMYVFDKKGQWLDEGLNHEGLSMEKTYEESNWYDEFSVHNF